MQTVARRGEIALQCHHVYGVLRRAKATELTEAKRLLVPPMQLVDETTLRCDERTDRHASGSRPRVPRATCDVQSIVGLAPNARSPRTENATPCSTDPSARANHRARRQAQRTR
jgi:hypothetical protein